MNVKQLSGLLIPIITLSASAPPDTAGDRDSTGKSFIISAREETTTPGGFSSVAEPAGPVDPEAAKRAAEEYAQKCIVPQECCVYVVPLATAWKDEYGKNS